MDNITNSRGRTDLMITSNDVRLRILKAFSDKHYTPVNGLRERLGIDLPQKAFAEIMMGLSNPQLVLTDDESGRVIEDSRWLEKAPGTEKRGACYKLTARGASIVRQVAR